MSNIKVAVRVRPLSNRESEQGSLNVVDVNTDVISLTNLKVDVNNPYGDSRERVKHFTYDFCYNSTCKPESSEYGSQEQIFQDLGTDVIQSAVEGYNACLFAYGQTSTGKTYTMTGTEDEVGLIPRICEGLFSHVETSQDEQTTFKIEISYLEIYNERVRDLLKPGLVNEKYTLKVREHPKDGPYVQDLSSHTVKNCLEILNLLDKGNEIRTTAATHMHEHSSRSHAIVTLVFTQAIFEDDLPREIISKIHLVDLAGSERADTTSTLNYKGRLKEGANINKSLVTLGNVIKSLAERSLMSYTQMGSTQSFASSSGESCTGAHTPREPNSPRRPQPVFIPYRDSVLTWLLRDSLGGNSKTIMISTITPASRYYNETLSTLRYAQRAKNIVNKPTINEDTNVALIRNLQEEIKRLRQELANAQMHGSMGDLFFLVPNGHNLSQSDSDLDNSFQAGAPVTMRDQGTVVERLQEKENMAKQLTQSWKDKWSNPFHEDIGLGVGFHELRRASSHGIILDSQIPVPHLVGLDQDILSTGVIIYRLDEGKIFVGTEEAESNQDIELNGAGINAEHCYIENDGGCVTIFPNINCVCKINNIEITEPSPLSQGDELTLGTNTTFRFNNPAEAARLREHRKKHVRKSLRDESDGSPTKDHLTLPPFSNHGNRITSQPFPMFNPSVELSSKYQTESERIDQASEELNKLRGELRDREQKLQLTEEEHQRQHQESKNEMEEEKKKLAEAVKEYQKKKAILEEADRETARILAEEHQYQRHIIAEVDKIQKSKDLETTENTDIPPDDNITIKQRKKSVEGRIKDLAQQELVHKVSSIEKARSLALQEEALEEEEESIQVYQQKVRSYEQNFRARGKSLIHEISQQKQGVDKLVAQEDQIEAYIQENKDLIKVAMDKPNPIRGGVSELNLQTKGRDKKTPISPLPHINVARLRGKSPIKELKPPSPSRSNSGSPSSSSENLNVSRLRAKSPIKELKSFSPSRSNSASPSRSNMGSPSGSSENLRTRQKSPVKLTSSVEDITSRLYRSKQPQIVKHTNFLRKSSGHKLTNQPVRSKPKERKPLTTPAPQIIHRPPKPIINDPLKISKFGGSDSSLARPGLVRSKSLIRQIASMSNLASVPEASSEAESEAESMHSEPNIPIAVAAVRRRNKRTYHDEERSHSMPTDGNFELAWEQYSKAMGVKTYSEQSDSSEMELSSSDNQNNRKSVSVQDVGVDPHLLQFSNASQTDISLLGSYNSEPNTQIPDELTIFDLDDSLEDNNVEKTPRNSDEIVNYEDNRSDVDPDYEHIWIEAQPNREQGMEDYFLLSSLGDTQPSREQEMEDDSVLLESPVDSTEDMSDDSLCDSDTKNKTKTFNQNVPPLNLVSDDAQTTDFEDSLNLDDKRQQSLRPSELDYMKRQSSPLPKDSDAVKRRRVSGNSTWDVIETRAKPLPSPTDSKSKRLSTSSLDSNTNNEKPDLDVKPLSSSTNSNLDVIETRAKSLPSPADSKSKRLSTCSLDSNTNNEKYDSDVKPSSSTNSNLDVIESRAKSLPSPTDSKSKRLSTCSVDLDSLDVIETRAKPLSSPTDPKYKRLSLSFVDNNTNSDKSDLDVLETRAKPTDSKSKRLSTNSAESNNEKSSTKKRPSAIPTHKLSPTDVQQKSLAFNYSPSSSPSSRSSSASPSWSQNSNISGEQSPKSYHEKLPPSNDNSGTQNSSLLSPSHSSNSRSKDNSIIQNSSLSSPSRFSKSRSVEETKGSSRQRRLQSLETGGPSTSPIKIRYKSSGKTKLKQDPDTSSLSAFCAQESEESSLDTSFEPSSINSPFGNLVSDVNNFESLENATNTTSTHQGTSSVSNQTLPLARSAQLNVPIKPYEASSSMSNDSFEEAIVNDIVAQLQDTEELQTTVLDLSMETSTTSDSDSKKSFPNSHQFKHKSFEQNQHRLRGKLESSESDEIQTHKQHVSTTDESSQKVKSAEMGAKRDQTQISESVLQDDPKANSGQEEVQCQILDLFSDQSESLDSESGKEAMKEISSESGPEAMKESSSVDYPKSLLRQISKTGTSVDCPEIIFVVKVKPASNDSAVHITMNESPQYDTAGGSLPSAVLISSGNTVAEHGQYINPETHFSHPRGLDQQSDTPHQGQSQASDQQSDTPHQAQCQRVDPQQQRGIHHQVQSHSSDQQQRGIPHQVQSRGVDQQQRGIPHQVQSQCLDPQQQTDFPHQVQSQGLHQQQQRDVSLRQQTEDSVIPGRHFSTENFIPSHLNDTIKMDVETGALFRDNFLSDDDRGRDHGNTDYSDDSLYDGKDQSISTNAASTNQGASGTNAALTHQGAYGTNAASIHQGAYGTNAALTHQEAYGTNASSTHQGTAGTNAASFHQGTSNIPNNASSLPGPASQLNVPIIPQEASSPMSNDSLVENQPRAEIIMTSHHSSSNSRRHKRRSQRPQKDLKSDDTDDYSDDSLASGSNSKPPSRPSSGKRKRRARNTEEKESRKGDISTDEYAHSANSSFSDDSLTFSGDKRGLLEPSLSAALEISTINESIHQLNTALNNIQSTTGDENKNQMEVNCYHMTMSPVNVWSSGDTELQHSILGSDLASCGVQTITDDVLSPKRSPGSLSLSKVDIWKNSPADDAEDTLTLMQDLKNSLHTNTSRTPVHDLRNILSPNTLEPSVSGRSSPSTKVTKLHSSSVEQDSDGKVKYLVTINEDETKILYNVAKTEYHTFTPETELTRNTTTPPKIPSSIRINLTETKTVKTTDNYETVEKEKIFYQGTDETNSNAIVATRIHQEARCLQTEQDSVGGVVSRESSVDRQLVDSDHKYVIKLNPNQEPTLRSVPVIHQHKPDSDEENFSSRESSVNRQLDQDKFSSILEKQDFISGSKSIDGTSVDNIQERELAIKTNQMSQISGNGSKVSQGCITSSSFDEHSQQSTSEVSKGYKTSSSTYEDAQTSNDPGSCGYVYSEEDIEITKHTDLEAASDNRFSKTDPRGQIKITKSVGVGGSPINQVEDITRLLSATPQHVGVGGSPINQVPFVDISGQPKRHFSATPDEEQDDGYASISLKDQRAGATAYHPDIGQFEVSPTTNGKHSLLSPQYSTVSQSDSRRSSSSSSSTRSLKSPEDREEKMIDSNMPLSSSEHSNMTLSSSEHSNMTLSSSEHSNMTLSSSEHSNMTLSSSEHSNMTLSRSEHLSEDIHFQNEHSIFIKEKSNIEHEQSDNAGLHVQTTSIDARSAFSSFQQATYTTLRDDRLHQQATSTTVRNDRLPNVETPSENRSPSPYTRAYASALEITSNKESSDISKLQNINPSSPYARAYEAALEITSNKESSYTSTVHAGYNKNPLENKSYTRANASALEITSKEESSYISVVHDGYNAIADDEMPIQEVPSMSVNLSLNPQISDNRIPIGDDNVDSAFVQGYEKRSKSVVCRKEPRMVFDSSTDISKHLESYSTNQSVCLETNKNIVLADRDEQVAEGGCLSAREYRRIGEAFLNIPNSTETYSRTQRMRDPMIIADQQSVIESQKIHENNTASSVQRSTGQQSVTESQNIHEDNIISSVKLSAGQQSMTGSQSIHKASFERSAEEVAFNHQDSIINHSSTSSSNKSLLIGQAFLYPNSSDSKIDKVISNLTFDVTNKVADNRKIIEFFPAKTTNIQSVGVTNSIQPYELHPKTLRGGVSQRVLHQTESDQVRVGVSQRVLHQTESDQSELEDSGFHTLTATDSSLSPDSEEHRSPRRTPHRSGDAEVKTVNTHEIQLSSSTVIRSNENIDISNESRVATNHELQLSSTVMKSDKNTDISNESRVATNHELQLGSSTVMRSDENRVINNNLSTEEILYDMAINNKLHEDVDEDDEIRTEIHHITFYDNNNYDYVDTSLHTTVFASKPSEFPTNVRSVGMRTEMEPNYNPKQYKTFSGDTSDTFNHVSTTEHSVSTKTMYTDASSSQSKSSDLNSSSSIYLTPQSTSDSSSLSYKTPEQSPRYDTMYQTTRDANLLSVGPIYSHQLPQSSSRFSKTYNDSVVVENIDSLKWELARRIAKLQNKVKSLSDSAISSDFSELELSSSRHSFCRLSRRSSVPSDSNIVTKRELDRSLQEISVYLGNVPPPNIPEATKRSTASYYEDIPNQLMNAMLGENLNTNLSSNNLASVLDIKRPSRLSGRKWRSVGDVSELTGEEILRMLKAEFDESLVRRSSSTNYYLHDTEVADDSDDNAQKSVIVKKSQRYVSWGDIQCSSIGDSTGLITQDSDTFDDSNGLTTQDSDQDRIVKAACETNTFNLLLDEYNESHYSHDPPLLQNSPVSPDEVDFYLGNINYAETEKRSSIDQGTNCYPTDISQENGRKLRQKSPSMSELEMGEPVVKEFEKALSTGCVDAIDDTPYQTPASSNDSITFVFVGNSEEQSDRTHSNPNVNHSLFVPGREDRKGQSEGHLSLLSSIDFDHNNLTRRHPAHVDQTDRSASCENLSIQVNEELRRSYSTSLLDVVQIEEPEIEPFPASVACSDQNDGLSEKMTTDTSHEQIRETFTGQYGLSCLSQYEDFVEKQTTEKLMYKQKQSFPSQTILVNHEDLAEKQTTEKVMYKQKQNFPSQTTMVNHEDLVEKQTTEKFMYKQKREFPALTILVNRLTQTEQPEGMFQYQEDWQGFQQDKMSVDLSDESGFITDFNINSPPSSNRDISVQQNKQQNTQTFSGHTDSDQLTVMTEVMSMTSSSNSYSERQSDTKLISSSTQTDTTEEEIVNLNLSSTETQTSPIPSASPSPLPVRRSSEAQTEDGDVYKRGEEAPSNTAILAELRDLKREHSKMMVLLDRTRDRPTLPAQMSISDSSASSSPVTVIDNSASKRDMSVSPRGSCVKKTDDACQTNINLNHSIDMMFTETTTSVTKDSLQERNENMNSDLNLDLNFVNMDNSLNDSRYSTHSDHLSTNRSNKLNDSLVYVPIGDDNRRYFVSNAVRSEDDADVASRENQSTTVQTQTVQDQLDKLQQERIEIIDLLNLNYLPASLTVELLEAKLNHCIGQTDALMKSVDDTWDDDLNSMPKPSVNKITEITQEYIDKYRRELKQSKRYFNVFKDEMERKLSKGRGRRTSRNSDIIKMNRKAQIEAFKLERLREQELYDKTKYISPRITPPASPARSSSSIFDPAYLTPRQRKSHLVNLRKNIIETSEDEISELRERSASPRYSDRSFSPDYYSLYSPSSRPHSLGQYYPRSMSPSASFSSYNSDLSFSQNSPLSPPPGLRTAPNDVTYGSRRHGSKRGPQQVQRRQSKDKMAYITVPYQEYVAQGLDPTRLLQESAEVRNRNSQEILRAHSSLLNARHIAPPLRTSSPDVRHPATVREYSPITGVPTHGVTSADIDKDIEQLRRSANSVRCASPIGSDISSTSSSYAAYAKDILARSERSFTQTTQSRFLSNLSTREASPRPSTPSSIYSADLESDSTLRGIGSRPISARDIKARIARRKVTERKNNKRTNEKK